MENNRFFASNEQKMFEFGSVLLKGMGCEGVVFLKGDLGLGKTTLSRGVIVAAGHIGAVKSPTYTLVEPYEFDGFSIYHFDLYRLSDPEELEYLGIRDYFSTNMLSLIEWPQKGQGFLPRADFEITLEIQEEGRALNCHAVNEKGQATLNYIQENYKQ